MLVCVDESGDTGLKLEKGSSPLFIVSAVFFADNDVASACDLRIKELRAELRVTPEFKFSTTSHDKRLAFLRDIAQYDFRYAAVVFNKAKLYGKGFRFKAPFYKTAVKYTMTHLNQYLIDAKVVLDRTGERAFTQSMQTYLKKASKTPDGTSRIKKVRSEDSKKNNLLQLADMVCGAVARSYSSRKDPQECRRLIRSREECVQYWPP